MNSGASIRVCFPGTLLPANRIAVHRLITSGYCLGILSAAIGFVPTMMAKSTGEGTGAGRARARHFPGATWKHQLLPTWRKVAGERTPLDLAPIDAYDPGCSSLLITFQGSTSLWPLSTVSLKALPSSMKVFAAYFQRGINELVRRPKKGDLGRNLHPLTCCGR